jgi:hypothetical protein
VYQKRPAAYKPRGGGTRAAVAFRLDHGREARLQRPGERMPRTKKSVKSRSKEKRKALKRRRVRRNKGLRRGKRGR